jgi:hypothetical protein
MNQSWIRRVVVAAALLLAAASGIQAATIVGPVLTSTELGHTGHGIIFNALQDATLTGFQFSNQGKADNVTLWDNTAGTMIGSIAVGAGNPVITLSVDWSLSPGHTYHLLGNTMSNGMFAYASFPVANEDIQVTSGFFSGLHDTAWGDFNNIETNGSPRGAVPEPGTWMMLGAGLALLGLKARRR